VYFVFVSPSCWLHPNKTGEEKGTSPNWPTEHQETPVRLRDSMGRRGQTNHGKGGQEGERGLQMKSEEKNRLNLWVKEEKVPPRGVGKKK